MSLRSIEFAEAYEVVRGGQGAAGIVLSCEHASARLPPAWPWPESDRRLQNTHWNVDIGAAEFTREMAELVGATAVLARFTRLLIDPNRVLDSATLFRDSAEGLPIQLNEGLDDEERQRRIDQYYLPFHRAMDRYIGQAQSANLLFSVHSFTPMYEGVARELELGVLFDENADLADAVCAGLSDAGFDARLNEPWSGLNGLMYSALRHATTYKKRSLEIEMRQDLSADANWRAQFAHTLRDVMRDVGVLQD